MAVWTTAPEIRCPRCTHRFEHSAHWELSLDHELECSQCGTILMLDLEESVRRWSWASKTAPTKGPAR